MKYIIGKNIKFWQAIHKANSAPLWDCIVECSWPANPKNKKSKLVISVKNDDWFKIIAIASGLKYSKYNECDCKNHENQCCDICTGWNESVKDKFKKWECRRCGEFVDMKKKRCKCKKGPSPWESVV